MLQRFSIALSLVLLAAPTFAAEEEDGGPFEGTVSFGYLATTGNTETTSMDTSGQAFTSSEDNVTNAEYYTARWRSRFDLTEKDFLFGRLNWRKDRFGAFDTQFSQTIGYGRRFLTGPKHTLNVEGGAGARQSEDQLGVKQDETILFGGLDYKWQFSETADFQQEFTIEAGDDNTFFESKSSVSATLIGALSLVASYTIRNNSDVPVGSEKTDTLTGIALEYKF